MSRDSFIVPAAGCFRGRVMPAGDGAVPASESAFGQGLRTGAHLRCFPSHRCAAGPSPFTKPRAATPSEVPVHPAFPGRGIMLQPLGWRDVPRNEPADASIRKSGPEIRNRCTEVPGMMLGVAGIVNYGPEIGNRCTEVHGMSPMAAAIAKLTPSNQESLHGSP